MMNEEKAQVEDEGEEEILARNEHSGNAMSYGVATLFGGFFASWMTLLTTMRFKDDDLSAETFIVLTIAAIAAGVTLVCAYKMLASLYQARSPCIQNNVPSLSTLTATLFCRRIAPTVDVSPLISARNSNTVPIPMAMALNNDPPPVTIFRNNSSNNGNDGEPEVYNLFGISQINFRPGSLQI